MGKITSDELRQILMQPEGLKLDFKRKYDLDKKAVPEGVSKQIWDQYVEGQWAELIKDILALTNGNWGTKDQDGLLIIGAGDALSAEGRELFDTSKLLLKDKELLEKVNKYCEPPIPNLYFERVELDSKWISLIRIPPSPHVHETTQPLITTSAEYKNNIFSGYKRDIIYTARVAFVRRGESSVPASDDERKKLELEKSPQLIFVNAPKLIWEDYLLSEEEKKKIAETFVQPGNFVKAVEALNKSRFLWIIGPAGIGKRTCALKLATLMPGRKILNIPRQIDWLRLADNDLKNATIVIADALGAGRFERQNLDNDLLYIEKIIENGNSIILTSPKDIFQEAKKTTRLTEWFTKDTNRWIFELDIQNYSLDLRLEIFQKLIDYCYQENGSLTLEQRDWATTLSRNVKSQEKSGSSPILAQDQKLFLRLLKEIWLPIDIDRFIMQSLPNARKAEDLREYLRKDADIHNRIRDWFANLDDNTRCFILTLCIFSGFDEKEIWLRYKAIAETLRKLDPALSILPLGILRQRAVPYVTQEGSVDFSNPRVYWAVTNEVVQNYREYLLELLDLLQEWTIPEQTNLYWDHQLSAYANESAERVEDGDRMKVAIQLSEQVRSAVAQVIGEAAKYGLNDVDEILNKWGSHKYGNIGKTVGIALSQLAGDPASIPTIIKFLQEWSNDYQEKDVSRYRRWSAASAFGRIASMQGNPEAEAAALDYLSRLARDPDPYVISSVAHSMRLIASSTQLIQIRSILFRLAGEPDDFTRRQTALAFDVSARTNPEGALALLDEWIATIHPKIVWTSIYSLIISRNLSGKDRYSRIQYLMESFPELFYDAFRKALEEKNDQPSALGTIKNMAGRSSSSQRQILINWLATISIKDPAAIPCLTIHLSVEDANWLQSLEAEALIKGEEIKQANLLAHYEDLLESNPEQLVYELSNTLSNTVQSPPPLQNYEQTPIRNSKNRSRK